LAKAKQATVYDPNMQDDLNDLLLQEQDIIKLFKSMDNSNDINKLALRHLYFIESVKKIEKKLIDPLFTPLMLVDEKWTSELESNSQISLYKVGNEHSNIVVKIDQVLGQSLPTGATRGSLPSPLTPMPTTTSTTTESYGTEPDVGNTETSFILVPQYKRKSTSTSTTTTEETSTTSTTISTSTSSTSTTTVPNTNLTVTVPPEQSWKDWLAEKWNKIKDFSEYLQMSIQMPSMYDILLMIVTFIHSAVILFLIFFRKPKRVVVRKMDLAANIPKMFNRRHSDSSVHSIVTKPKRSSSTSVPIRIPKRVQIQSNSSSDEEGTPLRTMSSEIGTSRTLKRLAPTPPYPLYPVPTAPTPVPQPPYARYKAPSRRGQLYLPKSVPLYLVESDIE